jgi:hypothetical protein
MYGEFDSDQAFFGVKSLFSTKRTQNYNRPDQSGETLTAYVTLLARARMVEAERKIPQASRREMLRKHVIKRKITTLRAPGREGMAENSAGNRTAGAHQKRSPSGLDTRGSSSAL